MPGWLTNGVGVTQVGALTGNEQFNVDTEYAGGVSPQSTALSLGQLGISGPQLLTATGATQGAATQITAPVAIITVSTASARGVKLPSAATGLRVWLSSLCTQGTKVYPFLGDRISSVATNTASVIAGFKSEMFIAKDQNTWALFKGA